MSNVYTKLQEARVKLQGKNFKKSGKNKYSGFTYYELSDFLPSINLIFEELKLCSHFNLNEAFATLSIINSEKPDEVLEFRTPTAELQLKGCTAIQVLGGVNTYCKRYLYLNALEIVENDLLDKEVGKLEEVPKKQDDTAIYEQVAQCQTVEELNILWKKEHSNVSDEVTFKNICASRKAILIEEKGENQ